MASSSRNNESNNVGPRMYVMSLRGSGRSVSPPRVGGGTAPNVTMTASSASSSSSLNNSSSNDSSNNNNNSLPSSLFGAWASGGRRVNVSELYSVPMSSSTSFAAPPPPPLVDSNDTTSSSNNGNENRFASQTTTTESETRRLTRSSTRRHVDLPFARERQLDQGTSPSQESRLEAARRRRQERRERQRARQHQAALNHARAMVQQAGTETTTRRVVQNRSSSGNENASASGTSASELLPPSAPNPRRRVTFSTLDSIREQATETLNRVQQVQAQTEEALERAQQTISYANRAMRNSAELERIYAQGYASTRGGGGRRVLRSSDGSSFLPLFGTDAAPQEGSALRQADVSVGASERRRESALNRAMQQALRGAQLPSDRNRQESAASSSSSAPNHSSSSVPRRVTRSMARGNTSPTPPVTVETPPVARNESSQAQPRVPRTATRFLRRGGRTPGTRRVTRSMLETRRTTRSMAALAEPATLSSPRKSAPAKKKSPSPKNPKSPPAVSSCCICMGDSDPEEASTIDSCAHKFCFECIEQWAERENTCPLCKERFTEISRDCGQTKHVEERTQRTDVVRGLGLFPHGVFARLVMSQLMGDVETASRMQEAMMMHGDGEAWLSVDGQNPVRFMFGLRDEPWV